MYGLFEINTPFVRKIAQNLCERKNINEQTETLRKAGLS